MAYKATILKKFIENNQIRLLVEFKKGSKTVEQEFMLGTPSQLKPEILRRISLLESLDVFATEPLGEVDLTTTSPDAEGLKKSDFFNKLDRLEKMHKYLTLGLVQESNISSLREELKILGKEVKEF